MARLLPNWLEAYLAFTYDQESPEIFHFWSGVSTIAGALRRSVWFDMGYFKLYPNMFIVLVSPPGRCKKSTAMRIAKGPLAQVPTVQIGVDSTSRERLITDLAAAFKDGQSPMTSHSSEFATMLTTSGMDMVVFLTDIYDSPEEWIHRTKSGGTSKIRAPCFNLLAGTTPDWMSKAMPLDTVGIGLTSRIIFVYSDQPRIRDPLPDLSQTQRELYKLLVNDITTISTIDGQYELDAEGKEFYRYWYKHIRPNETSSADPRLAGYYERKPMHALKLGMVLSASISNDLTITRPILEIALSKLADIEEPMARVFASVGKNPLAADYDVVAAYITTNNGGADFGEIADRFKHNVRADELREILDTLIAIGDITYMNGKYKGTV